MGKATHYAVWGLILVGLVAACRDQDAGTVAHEFVASYLVRADARAARLWSVGDARRKLDDEIRSLDGIESGADERPRVSFRELIRYVDAGRVRIDYAITVANGDTPAERRLRLLLERRAGAWRVFDFTLQSTPG